MTELQIVKFDQYFILQYKYKDEDYWRHGSQCTSLDSAIKSKNELNEKFKDTRAFRIIKVTEEEIG